MAGSVQIGINVDPMGDVEPVGDRFRRLKHRACGSQLAIRTQPASTRHLFAEMPLLRTAGRP